MNRIQSLFLLILLVCFLIWSFLAFNFSVWKQTTEHQDARNMKSSLKMKAKSSNHPHQFSPTTLQILGLSSSSRNLCLMTNFDENCIDYKIPSIFGGEKDVDPLGILAKEIHHRQIKKNKRSSSLQQPFLLKQQKTFGNLTVVLSHYNLTHALKKRIITPSRTTWSHFYLKEITRQKIAFLDAKRLEKEALSNSEDAMILHNPTTSPILSQVCSDSFSGRTVATAAASLAGILLLSSSHDVPNFFDDNNHQHISSSSSFTSACANHPNFAILKSSLLHHQVPPEQQIQVFKQLEALSCGSVASTEEEVHHHHHRTRETTCDFIPLLANDEEDSSNIMKTIFVLGGESKDEKRILSCLKSKRASISPPSQIILCGEESLRSAQSMMMPIFLQQQQQQQQNRATSEDDSSSSNVKNEVWLAFPDDFLSTNRHHISQNISFFTRTLKQTLDDFFPSSQREWTVVGNEKHDQTMTSFVQQVDRFIFKQPLHEMKNKKKNHQVDDLSSYHSSISFWFEFFFHLDQEGKNNKLPRSIITIATDYSAPMICGYIRAVGATAESSINKNNHHHHHHQDSSSFVVLLFAPVGTTAHDQYTFDRMIDNCNGGNIVNPVVVLWHRNIVESDRGFPFWRHPFLSHASSSIEESNDVESVYKHSYVIDDREAQEMFIELVAALKSGRSKSVDSSKKLKREHHHDDTQLITRYRRRDFVDPDFFILRSRGFVFEPITQTIVLLLGSEDDDHQHHHHDTIINSIFQDSFFSQYRHPILGRHQIKALNSIEWLADEIYCNHGDGIPSSKNHEVFSEIDDRSNLLLVSAKAELSSSHHRQHRESAASLEKALKQKMKNLKKLKRLGNVSKVRFGYRTEESGSSMIDLRVKIAKDKEEFAGITSTVFREARADEQLLKFYLKSKKEKHDKEELIANVKARMKKNEEEERKKKKQKQKQKQGSMDFLSSVMCSSPTKQEEDNKRQQQQQIFFFHYPWVRENVYHTFNDNFIPFIKSLQTILLKEEEAEEHEENPSPKFICPIDVQSLVDDASGKSLCLNSNNNRRLRFIQLPSDRSNPPLPVFDSLFEHLFGKDNILKSPGHDDEIVEGSKNNEKNKKGIVCSSSSNDLLVWGRPARPFSASSADVAKYFEDDDDDDDSSSSSTLHLVRLFLKMIALTTASKHQESIMYTNPPSSSSQTIINIVYLERKSKRVFESDLAFLAMVASYFDVNTKNNNNINNNNNHSSSFKVKVQTCCEGLSFIDQVRLIGSADILIGVHGAGLLNLIHLGLFRSSSNMAALSPLIVHIASKKLNYHEQTVIERLALMTSKALVEDQQSRKEIRRINQDQKNKLIFAKRRSSSSASHHRGVRFMSTRALVNKTRDPSQHWSDDFDLPLEEIEELTDRVFEKYLSGV